MFPGAPTSSPHLFLKPPFLLLPQPPGILNHSPQGPHRQRIPVVPPRGHLGPGLGRVPSTPQMETSQDPNDWGLILQIWRRRCILSLWPPHPLQPTAVNRWTDPSLGLSRALQRLLGGREGEQGQTQLHLPSPSPPPSKAGRPSSLRASSLLPVVGGASHKS